MQFEKKFYNILDTTNSKAIKNSHAFITPEHVIYTLTCYASFKKAYTRLNGDINGLKTDLKEYITTYIPIEKTDSPLLSVALHELFGDCESICNFLGDEEITLSHFLSALMNDENIFASYFIRKNAKDMDDYSFLKVVAEEMNQKEVPTIEEINEMVEEESSNINDILQGMVFPIPIIPQGGVKPPKKEKSWKQLVTCLNDKVEKENYIPLVGREKEITDTIAVLLRKNKNNPVHVGEAGVGKTAIAEGLAKRINEGNVPDMLKDYKIYSCSMGDLLAGTCLRGEFEEKLKSIFQGIAKEKAILYIDEIHTIVDAGGESASSAANILKPYLVNGDIKVIGSTTINEYRKTIEKDAALERRFSPITIEEPSKEDTLTILNGIKKYYESFHDCTYSEDVLNSIVNLSAKYMNDRFFPDKAIDIIDESGAYIRLNNIEDKIVTNDIIEEIIAKKCNIPRNTVSTDETSKIESLSSNMKKIVIGQDSAVDKISENIILSRSGLRDNNKPVANLLFVGPTGVGKTFIAQTLADSLGIPLIKKDMSEFTESHSVSKLFGSPAGYVGYNEGGLLINEIRKHPYCVLLLDEIEKAHPDVYNVFLQIMDDAKLTDSFGKSADFRNVILIMTSNAGAEYVEKQGMGFNTDSMNTSAIDEAVKQTFRPEFRNRLDAIIKFNPMSKEMAEKIAQNQMNTLSDMLLEKNVSLEYDNEIIDYIIKNGYSREYGARNIKRTIDNDIKLKLGKEILFGSLKNGGKCNISYVDNEIIIN